VPQQVTHMGQPEPGVGPSPEFIARTILGFAKHRYALRALTRANDPVWAGKLKFPNLGDQVYVELLPSLVLRVRDRETGEVLAQSVPGDFDVPDLPAPVVQKLFESWRAQRESRTLAGSTQGDGGGE